MKLNLNRTTSFLLLAFAILSTSVSGQADYNAAKNQFKRGIRSEKLSDRRSAIRRIRSTQDPRGVKDMLTFVHKSRKESVKLEKKARPLLKKLAKARGEFDKRLSGYLAQNPGSPTYPKGLVGQLPEKIDAMVADLAPVDKKLRLEKSTEEMLKTAIGDLISNLEESAQLEATNLFLSQYEKLRKTEQKALYLEILGYIHNPQAVIGLVGIAANASDSTSRVAALKALERLGDHRGGKAVKIALSDEQWQVRATAVEAARRFASIDMIPILIQRLKAEQGRVRGDIILTLSMLAGVDYSENTTLWERWWKENEKELREIVKNLKSENISDQAVGLQKMEAHGFLLAARRILEKRGLTLAAINAEESRRLVDPKVGSEIKENTEDEDAELAAVGKTIAERDETVREAALKSLVMEPFASTWNPKKRQELIQLMGSVGGKKAIARLVGLMRVREGHEEGDFNRRMKRREKEGRIGVKWRYDPKERIHAVNALALCATGTNDEMEQLRKIFSEESTSVELMLAAITAYEKVDTKRSVSAMIRALGEITSQGEEAKNRTAGVAKALTDALRRSTAQEIGDSHDEWTAWWDKSESDFKTASEKLKEENPGVAAAGEEVGGTRFYGIKTYSKRIVFILDISGSMNEPAEYEGKTKIQVAKAELTTAISSLPKDAQFNIIFYSTDYHVWQKKLVVADAKIKKAAKSFIADTKAGGGTNIYEPLVKVFDIAGRGSKDEGYGEVALDTIFFLSDGQPTAGRITKPEDILNKVLGLNSLRKIKIHTIGVGKGHARDFMRKLAERSGGKYVSK
ncbi:MAG: HEAT repeat protein [Planctomycetota bacterium]|jgi:HEAT repeat protein